MRLAKVKTLRVARYLQPHPSPLCPTNRLPRGVALTQRLSILFYTSSFSLARQGQSSLVRAKEELEEEILLIQSSRLWGSCPSVRLPKDWQPDIIPRQVVMYKLVAAVGTKLVSVYDSSTEYWLGRKTVSKRGAFGWPPLDSCFFVYKTPMEASEATFPKKSRCAKAPKVLMKVLVSGMCYKHESGRKWACKEVTPVYFFKDVQVNP